MTIIFCDYDNLRPLIDIKNKLKNNGVKFTHGAEPKPISDIMAKSTFGPLKALISQVPVPVSIKEDLAKAKVKNPKIKDLVVSKLPDGNYNIHDMDSGKGLVIKNESDFEKELLGLINDEVGVKDEPSPTNQEDLPKVKVEINTKPESRPEIDTEETKKEEKSSPQKAKPLTNKDK